MTPDVLNQLRSSVPLVDQRVELTAANFDNGEFARDEEAIQRHQRGDGREFSDHNDRGVPVVHDCFCNRETADSRESKKVHGPDAPPSIRIASPKATSWT